MNSLLDADVDSEDEFLEIAAVAAAGVKIIGSKALNNAQRNRKERNVWDRPIIGR